MTAASLLSVFSGSARTLHVAPNGNDAWSGRLDTPAADGRDGPLASLRGARDALRKWKGTGAPSEPVTVLFRGGRYFLEEPVRFTPRDSGAADAPVTYAAYPGEHPEFRCGRSLKGFRVIKGVWQLEIPEVRAGTWFFRSLYVNGRRAVRARTPNVGEYYYIAGKAPPAVDPKTGKEIDREYSAFLYNPGELKHWRNFADVDLVVYDAWDTSILPIEALNEKERAVSFRTRGIWKFKTWDGRYYVEHAPDALDAPGEWYLDRERGLLSYIPLPGETPETADVVAPLLVRPLQFQGNRNAKRFVEHLHFQGLSFRYTDWHRNIAFQGKGRAGAVKAYALTDEPVGYRGVQAAFQVPGAIELRDTRHCAFRDCEVAFTGGYAFVLDDGAKDTNISRCHLHHLGGGGVRMGCQFTRTGAALAEGNIVDNCFIHYGGRVYRAAVGVLIMRSSHNRVTHNEISDFTYSAVSVGWDWGYGESSARDNRIEWNHLHRLGRGHLSDMGGIYTLGISPGTVLRHNLIHDMACYKYGATALYQDQASSEILLENNVCYNCQTGGYTLGYGRENVVRNNILALGTSHQISLGRPEKDHRQLTFERNIVYYRDGRLTGHKWEQGTMLARRNLYWDASGEPVTWGAMTIDEWREKTGNDRDSLIADPKFANPEQGDFTLAPASPALKLGFQPIDLAKVGLYGDKAWTGLPAKAAILPMEPVPPPRELRDDYEDAPVGSLPAQVTVHGEIPGVAGIRVTDRLAAGGRHSLEFTDAPEVKNDYNPHMVFDSQIRDGLVTCALDLRREAGAKITIEWRDWFGGPIRTGPRVSIDDQGNLHAAGRDLAVIPLETWVHLEMRCQLGKRRTGTFDLSLTLPGKKKQSWAGLACGYRKFDKMNWFGIISGATGIRTRFQIDNLALTVRQNRQARR